MPFLKIEVGEMQANCYLFYCPASRQCLIIDPGAEPRSIQAWISRENLLPRAVILTHDHPDHAGAAAELMDHFRIPLWAHEADEFGMHSEVGRGLAALFGVTVPPRAGRLLADGDELKVGELELKVIHSPGHTKGSILLYGDGLLFTGDTLFKGDVGRTDLPGGSEGELRHSLDKIKEFPPRTRILPGHGEDSLLEVELRENPFL